MGVVIVIRHSLRGVNMIHRRVDGTKVRLDSQVSVNLPFDAPPMMLTEHGLVHSEKIGRFIADHYDVEHDVVVRADSSTRTQMTGLQLLKAINSCRRSPGQGRLHIPMTNVVDPIAYAHDNSTTAMSLYHAYHSLFRIEQYQERVASVLKDIFGFRWDGPSAITPQMKLVGAIPAAKSLSNLAIFEYIGGNKLGRLTIGEDQVSTLTEFARDCVELRVSSQVVEQRCSYLMAYIKQQLAVPNRLTVVVSHDTNIHGLLKLLGVSDRFQIDQWPQMYIPPTSGLVLEPLSSTNVRLSSIGVRCSDQEEMFSEVVVNNLVLPETCDELLQLFTDEKDCLHNYVGCLER